MAAQPELEEEQEFLDQAHDGLEAMREDARRMLDSVIDLGRGGTFQSRTERDIVVRTSLARLAQLDIGDQALCFGRIDRVPEEGQSVGESFHIGRLAVSGPDREPLVVDWRAPVAEPFYRATGLDPHGLVRRRHLAVQGTKVVGLEDEYFGGGVSGPSSAQGSLFDDHSADNTDRQPRDGESLGQVSESDAMSPDAMLVEGDIDLGGPGALLAAVGRVRTGHMADIVSTIQREQDEIIRSPLAGLLIVQGGPGTGKTAVALHRAAYLLYTHRFPLERQGVLVVGPNPLFLRYIEQVLPSLGETGVTLSTVSGLVPEVRVRGVDEPRVAVLKGDPRMAGFIARAVRTRERRLPEDIVVPFGSATLRLSAADSGRIVDLARRRSGTHNSKRRFVENQVGLLLAQRYDRFRGASEGPVLPDEGGDEGRSSDQEADQVEIARQLRRIPVVAAALDRMWPRLAPHELVHDLLGSRPLLSAAGKGVLDPAEVALLYRPRSASFDDVQWTAGDAALVDEARALLGPRRPRKTRRVVTASDRPSPGQQDFGSWLGAQDSLLGGTGVTGRNGGGDDEVRSYGHIVVDETQDLSPMQLRMLARRSISGSMTVVGDIAQATGAWAPASWSEVAGYLSPNRPPRQTELTVSYRTPLEVVEVSSRVLAAAAPDIAPPRPVRRSGFPPVIERVTSASLLDRISQVTAAQMASLSPGRVAVLAPGSLLAGLKKALAERGIDGVDPREAHTEGLAAPLVLLPAEETNGLEFDGVVVVEPALIAGDPTDGEMPPGTTTRGLRTLYVTLTRPTQQLAVVYSMPLPVDLKPSYFHLK